MLKLAKVLIGLIAALHMYIAWFEIFAWETRGPSVFPAFPSELFSQTVSMAANQGLYNGFLAAGLIWSLLIRDAKWQANIAFCFLTFVAIAGIFGAFTVSPRIAIIQTAPAFTAMICLFIGRLNARSHLS